MADKKSPEAGAVEINETDLDKASGGAYDAFLKLDGIPGETKSLKTAGYDLKAAKKV